MQSIFCFLDVLTYRYIKSAYFVRSSGRRFSGRRTWYRSWFNRNLADQQRYWYNTSVVYTAHKLHYCTWIWASLASNISFDSNPGSCGSLNTRPALISSTLSRQTSCTKQWLAWLRERRTQGLSGAILGDSISPAPSPWQPQWWIRIMRLSFPFLPYLQ